MTGIESVVLGAVQGLTEFIPVSSSGHVILAEKLFSGAGDHLFVEWINLGTLLALLIYFRVRIIDIVREVCIGHNYKLARNVLIACVPAGLAGFLLASFIEKSSFFGNVWTVLLALCVVGIVMVLLEKLPRLSSVARLSDLPWQRALVIGVVQVLALIPGVSRSGSTIVTGRLAGLSREHAAEFSFLVSIPIMLGVAVKLFVKGTDRAYFMQHLPTLALSNLIAFVTGLFAVGFLLRYLAKHDLRVFGWYRIGVSLLVACLLLIQ